MAGQGTPRFQHPERRQIQWQAVSLDQLLPHDHEARLVWAYVDQLDLTPLYEEVKAVEGNAGRPPIHVKILLSLWLYATIDGIGSARKVDELCKEHLAYQWLCGGVSVNHHTIGDFRVEHVEFLDQLLTQSVAALLHQGLISLQRLAQDGMRVRASAGAASFRRQPTLEESLAEAENRVQALKEEMQNQDGGVEDRRRTAARQRAAEDRARRVRDALEELPEIQRKMERRQKGSGKTARVSTTDPQARKMKMPSGGFRPAYNVQFSTTADTLVIVGADVTNSGGDGGLMSPMLEQIQDRHQQLPDDYLADGGFSTKDDIEALQLCGVTVYSPVKEEEQKRKKGEDPFARREGDSDAIAAWRERMGTDEAREIYKQRAPTAEFPNAGCRNRGLNQFLVRGLEKVRAVVLWHALAHNFRRALSLQARAAASG